MGTKIFAKSEPWKIIATAFLACIVIATISLSFGATEAWAGGQPYSGQPNLDKLSTSSTVVTSMKSNNDTYRSISSSKSPSKKISNAKSSNEAVATVEVNSFKNSGKNYYSLAINLKAAGSTNISFKWGSKSYKIKYTVKKYANPLKKFKIGSKNYASGFAPAKQQYQTGVVIAKTKSLTGKLQVKLAKGWKLKKAWYWSNNKPHFVKNGGKVNKAQSVWVSVQKGKLNEEMYIYATSNSLRAA